MFWADPPCDPHDDIESTVTSECNKIVAGDGRIDIDVSQQAHLRQDGEGLEGLGERPAEFDWRDNVPEDIQSSFLSVDDGSDWCADGSEDENVKSGAPFLFVLTGTRKDLEKEENSVDRGEDVDDFKSRKIGIVVRKDVEVTRQEYEKVN